MKKKSWSANAPAKAAPDRLSTYFRKETGVPAIVTVTGILYNIGMVAGPWFEGQLVQCLLGVFQNKRTIVDMLSLSGLYLAVIFLVQLARSAKRFYVRRFANDTSRNMRHMLYNSLVHKSKQELDQEKMGTVMTKAISDVDDCVEGMRKFTTEVFDTGVVLVAYIAMLLWYDWRLTLLAGAFIPVAYLIAAGLKKWVTKCNAAYKCSAGSLNEATMDRVGNAMTYRVYGCETNRDEAYESRLTDYERKAVRANFWENAMQPVYHVISMCGIVLLLYFGAKNVLGTGWKIWDIAAFTTFLSCFAKMALKSSKAAKLFNAVQKAEVSWKRLKPMMQEYSSEGAESSRRSEASAQASCETNGINEPCVKQGTEQGLREILRLSNVSFGWDRETPLLKQLEFSACPGQIIGVTGMVACGKSTLGKVLIGELAYLGNIRVCGRELRTLSEKERFQMISYMGHEPELMSDTVIENICMGDEKSVQPYVQMACLEELQDMPEQLETMVGNGGRGLSGGQQARVAFARTLYHGKQLLVLDDPFSAVDRRTEQQIFAQLKSYGQDKAILLISHRLYLFPQLDGVLFLHDGTGTCGSHEQLMEQNQLYRNLYETQIGEKQTGENPKEEENQEIDLECAGKQVVPE